MDLDKKGLFPEINPNVDELIEKENAIDKEEIIKDDDMDYSAPKSGHNEIFMKSKGNVKMKIKDPTDTITENDVVKKNQKKGRYSHLAEARKKGIETRRRKAEEKRKAKEAEKLKKAEEREARKKATAERNREKARQRYYKQKEKNKTTNVAKKIVEQTNTSAKQQIKAPNQGNMDFNTFARYMMKYEQMKDAYNKAKNKSKSQQKSKPISIPKQPKNKNNEKVAYHPPNYPLDMFAPSNRYKEFTGF